MFNMYIFFKWIKTPEADKITETAGKKAWISFLAKIPRSLPKIPTCRGLGKGEDQPGFMPRGLADARSDGNKH